MTDVFEDSQATIPESVDGSQDLFNLQAQPLPPLPKDPSEEILQRLDALRADVAQLRKEIADMRNVNVTVPVVSSFKFETASCKRRFNLFLRNSFSCCPWLETKSNRFRDEVQTCLTMDNMRNNPAAFKAMTSFAATKFTELRNQFRRKVFAEKSSMACKPLNELCCQLFKGFCKPDESVLSEERLHATLLLRLFLHKRKYFNDKSAKYAPFWADFKSVWEEMEKDKRSQKWEKLEEVDRRRTERTREMGNSED